MSLPTIRMGDPGTTTGLTTPSLTVLIGGLPAVYVSVPITAGLGGLKAPPAPGVPADGPSAAPAQDAPPPPPPLPSVPGVAQWSTTVFINGQPAVRPGDLASYGATLIATQFTVLVGPALIAAAVPVPAPTSPDPAGTSPA